MDEDKKNRNQQPAALPPWKKRTSLACSLPPWKGQSQLKKKNRSFNEKYNWVKKKKKKN